MNSYALIFILVGISISFLLLGYTPTAFDYMSKLNTLDATSLETILGFLAGYFSNWSNLFALVGIIGVGAIALRGNLPALIPFILVFVIIDFMVLPAGAFIELGIVGELINVILKIVLVTTMISFLRTG